MYNAENRVKAAQAPVSPKLGGVSKAVFIMKINDFQRIFRLPTDQPFLPPS